jgi:hypothetical protein
MAFFLSATLASLLALTAASPLLHVESSSIANPASPQPISPYQSLEAHNVAPKGLRVQFVGHSFHFFLPGLIDTLAKEAGILGHRSLGMDMIPARSEDRRLAAFVYV